MRRSHLVSHNNARSISVQSTIEILLQGFQWWTTVLFSQEWFFIKQCWLEYVYIIDQARDLDDWILAEFSFCVFMDRDEVEVHKSAKREHDIRSTEKKNDLRCLFSSTEKARSPCRPVSSQFWKICTTVNLVGLQLYHTIPYFRVVVNKTASTP